MFTQKLLVSVALVIGCSTIPASATMTTCTAPGCLSVPSDTFSNIAFAQGNLGTSTSNQGVVFSTDSAGLTGVTNIPNWPAGTAIESSPGVNTLTIAFPTGVNAFEFYVGPQDFSFFTITVTDNSSGSFSSGNFHETFTSPAAPAFFAASTDSSFASLTILSQASVDQMTIDAMQIGEAQAAPTPEVATLLLVATGLFLMGYGRRRWILKPAAAR